MNPSYLPPGCEDTDGVDFESCSNAESEMFKEMIKYYIYKHGGDNQDCCKCKVKFVPFVDGGSLTVAGWKCHKCFYGVCV